MSLSLPQKLVALEQALSGQQLRHAFGGAIALAYWTLDPRGTGDIDLNIFVPAADCADALRALPEGVAQPPGTVEEVQRKGQNRLWWDQTPIDLFFDNLPVHAEAARNVKRVPFEGIQIPILGPTELAVFKAMFARTRDWADIEAMLEAGTLDPDAVRKPLRSMLDADDPRFARLDEACRRSEELSG